MLTSSRRLVVKYYLNRNTYSWSCVVWTQRESKRAAKHDRTISNVKFSAKLLFKRQLNQMPAWFRKKNGLNHLFWKHKKYRQAYPHKINSRYAVRVEIARNCRWSGHRASVIDQIMLKYSRDDDNLLASRELYCQR